MTFLPTTSSFFRFASFDDEDDSASHGFEGSANDADGVEVDAERGGGVTLVSSWIVRIGEWVYESCDLRVEVSEMADGGGGGSIKEEAD